MKKNNIEVKYFPIGQLEANMTLLIDHDSHEAIAVDPGNDFAKFCDICNNLNIKVTKLLHTHGHFDHIGQSPTIKNKFGAKILLHGDDLDLYNSMTKSAALYGQKVAAPVEADTLFNESDINLFNDVTIRIIHTPGHSLGSCCFYTNYFETPLLISGDTLFKRSIGRTDLPGGSFEQIINSIKTKLLTLPSNTLCICGHGPTTTIGEEIKFNPFL